ncbi:hypothetical protein [Kamptonema formosum]|uniref:hypothetical protein n=1 Tax=Kamptonema formosum TaxID=331992 RepID=UPI0003454A9D|nr:hypothetical protein [Oscillatoria sp. PCC 10802]
MGDWGMGIGGFGDLGIGDLGIADWRCLVAIWQLLLSAGFRSGGEFIKNFMK